MKIQWNESIKINVDIMKGWIYLFACMIKCPKGIFLLYNVDVHNFGIPMIYDNKNNENNIDHSSVYQLIISTDVVGFLVNIWLEFWLLFRRSINIL